MSEEWRRVNSLTRLHLTVVTERHANESICVCPQGTDGIPGAEVQLAFDYRSSSGATATQSDTVWPARGNDDTFPPDLPRGLSRKKKKKKRNRKEPLSFCRFRSISKRTEQRLAPFSLFRSESILRSKILFFFSLLCVQLRSKTHEKSSRSAQMIFQYLNSQCSAVWTFLEPFTWHNWVPTRSISYVVWYFRALRLAFVQSKSGHSMPDIICARVAVEPI